MFDGNRADRPHLLVFADDWGRHPSSAQHLIARLLPSYCVTWVNTIGMRRPSFNLATVTRAFGKIRSWLASRRQETALPANLTVLNPWMWPWFTTARDRKLNRLLLRRQLGRWLREQNGPVVAITTIPIVADILGDLPVSRWVYYCVDDFGKWPGLDHEALDLMESVVIERADVLIAVSEPLKEKLMRRRRDVALLTHGVDLEHWRTGAAQLPPVPLEEFERPLVVFWGLIDDRMDTGFVERLAQELPKGTILLVGPLQSPDPGLLRLDRVRHVPAVGYDELPQFGQAADVLIMPYRDAPVTQAMQPLKLLEYMATGKPVVARDLPSTRPWADCLDLAATAEEFSSLVAERIRVGLPDRQSAVRERIESEGWAGKAQEFQRLTLAHGCASSSHR